MSKKVTKKKKAVTKTARSKPVRTKKSGSTLTKARPSRPKMGPAVAARSLPRSTVSSRRPGYYGMGAIALGLTLHAIGYYTFKNDGHMSTGTDEVRTQARVPAAAETPEVQAETSVVAPETPVVEQVETPPAHKEKTPEEKPQTEASAITGPLAPEFKEVQSLDLQGKIGFWSKYIEKNLSGRKKVKALMSGREVDDIAPIIPDNYDCTTFVETVAAFARSQSPGQVFKNLLSIRYLNGKPGFATRNHFPEADWIPNNQHANLLKDITGEVAKSAGLHAKIERNKIDRKKWLHEQAKIQGISREICSLTEKAWDKPINAKVSYIEIADIKKVLREIPNGTVLNLVHKNDGHHPVLITHQGFVIREGNQVLLRHASRGGHIRTNDLSNYLNGLLRKQNPNTNWPLIGINLNQIKGSTSDSNRLSDEM